jgi:DnaJ family protein C protein 28
MSENATPPTAQPGQSARPPRSEQAWQDLVSQQIEEAMRAGAFDNLPGKGKPQDLGTNPNAPSDMDMANRILKENDLSPGWIADRKEMLAKIDDLRQRLSTTWERRQSADDSRAPAFWADDLVRFQTEIDDLNRKIATVNLGMAISRLEIFRLNLDNELKRIGASRQV